MIDHVPRMRMFAGPNGSGKSTIKSFLSADLLGVYVNPDDIQKELTATGRLDLASFSISATTAQIRQFLSRSTLLNPAHKATLLTSLHVRKSVVRLPHSEIDAYLASVLSDFIRRKLIAAAKSFTFETVMSSRDKVDLFDDARAQGFRTYLYYIATEDPLINVSRVRNRVSLGGHPVPADKIVARYARSLDLLYEAIRKCDRAYLFDNSGREPEWLAEITGGAQLTIKAAVLPAWLQKSVLDKLPSA